ncbi:MAG: hypothetical protein JNL42_17480 [Anaerolineae bacterium]|nr:hypothetical protein [Anaerolineae bacterium]
MNTLRFRPFSLCTMLLFFLVAGVVVAAGSVAGTQDPAAFPLAQPGPYASGYTSVTTIDTARQNREVRLRLLYPAVEPAEADARRNNRRDAEPERSGAPYPLILTSTNDGSRVNWQLPSHGFVVAYPADAYPVAAYDDSLIDYPRDLVFALQQLADDPPALLAGVIDTDRTGVMGYSWGGYGALAVSGARADPDYYLSQCRSPTLEAMGYPAWWNDYACALAPDWEAFAARTDPALTSSSDELWQPITDARIRAVAPLAPEGALLFGSRGLAFVDRPTLILTGTADVDNPYAQETVPIFEQLGTPDKTLISFVGREHLMILSESAFAPMRHFVTAFFGYHLQGRQDYAEWLSQAYVEQFDDLAWGVYPAAATIS